MFFLSWKKPQNFCSHCWLTLLFVLVLPSLMLPHVIENLLRLCQCKQTSGKFNIWHAATYSASVFSICQRRSQTKTKRKQAQKLEWELFFFFQSDISFSDVLHVYFLLHKTGNPASVNVRNARNGYVPHCPDAAISALPFEILHFPIGLIHFCWIHVFWQKHIICGNSNKDFNISLCDNG